MTELKIDVSSLPLYRELSDVQGKQIPFALVLTQTRLAQRVKAGELEVMKQRLDRPTPTTLKSLFVQSATKSRPARVWFKDQWTTGIPADAYLQQQVLGGVRPHKRFEKALIAQGLMKSGQYAVPTAAFLNQYGNVSRGTMVRILSGLGAAESGRGYQANATGSRRSQAKGNAKRFFVGSLDGSEGVWERKGTAFGEGVRPVFLFTGGAPGYRVRFPFHKIAENIVKARQVAEASRALDEVMATARP